MAVHEKAGTLVRIGSTELAVENKGIGSKEMAVMWNEIAVQTNESAVNELAVWKT